MNNRRRIIIKNQNVELHIETLGFLKNTPILLIAGAMAPAIFWNDYFCNKLVSKGYYVIRFDNRDIGKSTHFPQSAPDSEVKLPYFIEDMVEDTKAVLDSYQIKEAHIIGHSLGGSIAQLFAIKYPEKTGSLTIISAPVLAKGQLLFLKTDQAITDKIWKVLMSNPMYQDYQKGAPEFLKIWRFLNGDWELDENMANEYTKSLYMTEIIGPAWNHTHVQNNIRDIINELEKLDKRILFIHGEKDYLPSNPKNTKILADHLDQADFFLLKNGGHMFFNKEIWNVLSERILSHINKK